MAMASESDMKKASKSPKPNLVYPIETKGSKLAAQLRSEANSLSDQQRADCFKLGMQLIYGGSPSK